MGKIIAFSNQKGGVGKTTTVLNVADYVARAGKKVLMVDIDPQGNLTSGYGFEKNELDYTLYDLMLGNAEFKDVALTTGYPGRYPAVQYRLGQFGDRTCRRSEQNARSCKSASRQSFSLRLRND